MESQHPENPKSSSVSLTEGEISVLAAQRDHFSSRCTELETLLRSTEAQLAAKFTLRDLSTTDTSLFEGETLERLREWRECLEFVIGEKEEREKMEKKSGMGGNGTQGESEGEEGKGERMGGEGKGKRDGKKTIETELPFSPLGLSGFLTRNHRLTQKHTEYPSPDPKPKKKES